MHKNTGLAKATSLFFKVIHFSCGNWINSLKIVELYIETCTTSEIYLQFSFKKITHSEPSSLSSSLVWIAILCGIHINFVGQHASFHTLSMEYLWSIYRKAIGITHPLF